VQCLRLDGRRTCGVSALVKGHPTTLTAKREVVLCAAAIASPRLLLLSGIRLLQGLVERNINMHHELPGVGENLQDHLQAPAVLKCQASTMNLEVDTFSQKALVALRYALSRSGPMSMAASLGAAFFRTRPELEIPDVQFHVQPFSKDNLVDDTHDFSAFTASVRQLRLESTARLALNSEHANDYPAIHPKYSSTAMDCKTLVAGIRIAQRIGACEPLKSIVTGEHAPGSDVGDAHDEILAWARSSATTIFHPTGTCKMGSDAWPLSTNVSPYTACPDCVSQIVP
jgi:choline dehydrogenase